MRSVFVAARWVFLTVGTFGCFVGVARAQPQGPEFNYDEARVRPYALPSLLTFQTGKRSGQSVVTKAEARDRRLELIELFSKYVYGRTPRSPLPRQRVVWRERDVVALDGKALRSQVRIELSRDAEGPGIDVLLYRPRQAKGPVPAFLG